MHSYVKQYLLEDVALVPDRLSKISSQVLIFLHLVILCLVS
jgi:hypothetical protein